MMKKRVLALFLAFVMLLGCGVPLLMTYGAVGYGSGEASLLQEGDYDLPTIESSHYGTMAASVRSAVEESIYQQLMEVKSSVDISSYNIPTADIDALYSKVINDNPDLFYVSSSYSFNYYPRTGCVAFVTPRYAITQAEIAQAKDIFDAGVAKALSCVDDSMTDEQKVIVLHDYICSQALYPVLEYDNNGYLANDREIWHSAYGFFYDKTVVCAGFTLVYSYLLHQLGIESEYVGSDAMQHAWNKVQLDGSWYNVDLTYDNADNAQGVNTLGSVRHWCCLKSDAYFASEDGFYHYGGVTYTDTTADNTAYDNAFFSNVDARIYAVDGDYYYLQQGDNLFRTLLKKRSAAGVESVVYSEFRLSTYYNNTTYAFDENGTQHNIVKPIQLVRLSYLDNRFYVAAGKSIYAVTKDGRLFTIVSGDTVYDGLEVNDDADLIYQYHTGSAEEFELDKTVYFRNYLSTDTNGTNYNNYPDINLDGYVNAKDYALILQQRNNS